MGALFYHRRSVALIAAAAFLAAASLSPAEDPAQAPARYRFEPGQKLLYKITSTENLAKKADDEPQRKTETQWHVYVVRANDDGSRRLLVRRSEKMLTYPNAAAKPGLGAVLWKILTEGPAADPSKPRVDFENSLMGYVDLTPSGTFEKNPSLGSYASYSLQPEELFCQLPADGRAPGQWWEYEGPASRETFKLTFAPAEDGTVAITGSKSLPDDVNYDLTREVNYRFDSRRGLIDKIVVDTKYVVRGEKGHARSTVELVSEEKLDPAAMAAFAAEADAYIAASEAYSKSYEAAEAARTRDECKATFDQARAELTAARDAAKDADIRALYEAKLKSHDEQLDYELRGAQEREELYAMPPVDWETTDIDGKPQKLVDYRGKVLVMDFWYRGCGHCIKALPKIKRLAARYQDKPVVVMGINNDTKDEDAKFVIETFDLRYPTLRNGSISKSYHVSGWPSLVVLDQSGRVAQFHVGNSDDLEEKVAAAVDELLAHPVPAETSADPPAPAPTAP
jgi:thiol-disulfide isomerase/thioredoxin